MPYLKKTYRLPDRIEYEHCYAGRYGLKGEKRAKRKKPSPEQMQRQNQINRANRTRRVIAANFGEGDYFATLKYPAGTRKDIDEVKKDFKNFRQRLSRIYKKYGTPLKYIYRIEVGKLGGIHIHIILNRISGVDTDILIQEKWTYGRVNFQTIYESGGYRKLADYMTKQPKEGNTDYEQLQLFEKDERKSLLLLESSRNLVRPEPEVKKYTRRGVMKLVTEGPEPTEVGGQRS